MHLKTDDLMRLEIDFESGSIPPPFSHRFKLKLNFEKNFLNTSLDMEYTHREELTDEEILNEGFTLEDDYHWKGELHNAWVAPIKKLYTQSKWSNKKLEEEEGGIRVLAKDIHGKITRTTPLNQEDWQYEAQELIQAIFETSQKEAPLSVNFLHIDSEKTLEISLVMKFSVRKAVADINGQEKQLNWEKTKDLLSNVFLPDYDYDKVKESKPSKRGSYIDCGDGFWHEFGKGIYNIDASYDAVSRIKEGFLNL
ncbi:hypothetical protein ACFOUP_18705 [Belliella kenyensis]|uniref:Uncharacterized protein n=1 Tax=Belliella kenyensis TaxID=1472724 RepID=A0ABV8EQ27_9BACT|nr:hypothetical protein [Belliella kenyensis]MCH7402192.1 hypothetical protein [Belliella kenyensis]MDN3601707.1 hypothetical protein [Belliella kenyensis]